MERTFGSIVEDIEQAAALEVVTVEQEAYCDEMVSRIVARGKVTRIDLYHIISSLSQYEPVWQPESEAAQRLVSLYNEMDKAAAFGEMTTPLVYAIGIDPDSIEAWQFYSVVRTDNDVVREAKREAQKPSTISEREWNTK